MVCCGVLVSCCGVKSGKDRGREEESEEGRGGGKVYSPCIPLPPPPPPGLAGAAEWQLREKVGGSVRLKKFPWLRALPSFSFLSLLEFKNF